MTTDNLFTGVLTLSLLAAGTLAFGHDLASAPSATPAPTRVVMMPMVMVTGHRAPADVIVVKQAATPVRVASL